MQLRGRGGTSATGSRGRADEPGGVRADGVAAGQRGRVTVADGGYVHAGRPIGGELAEALVRLHTAGHLTIGTLGPGRHRPAHTTVAGAVRLAELGRGRHG